MKHMKILAGCLASAMVIASTAVPVAAQTQVIDDNTFICDYNTNEITPYLDYLTSVFCDILYRDGKIEMQANCTSFKSNPINLTIYLERSSDKTNWTTLSHWSKTFNPGNGANIVSGKYGTSAAGYYRAKATALVYNSSGSIVENVTVYSSTIRI